MGRRGRIPRSFPELVLLHQKCRNNPNFLLDKEIAFTTQEIGNLYYLKEGVLYPAEVSWISQRCKEVYDKYPNNPGIIDRVSENEKSPYLIRNSDNFWPEFKLLRLVPKKTPSLDTICQWISNNTNTKPRLRALKSEEFSKLAFTRIFIRSKVNPQTDDETFICDIKRDLKSREVIYIKLASMEQYTPNELKNSLEYRLNDSSEWKPFGVYE